jgi:hypothetical protein
MTLAWSVTERVGRAGPGMIDRAYMGAIAISRRLVCIWKDCGYYVRIYHGGRIARLPWTKLSVSPDTLTVGLTYHHPHTPTFHGEPT